ncbi:hypothetical protein [Streptomyces sp. 3211]|uniref:hypothetical protein n=1 Tax=Streptomyces sp. 3211 TaxID=1964449 RepID=UPI0009A4AAB6|nr:hypothetical protein [Streptomyces sp. 3211]
MLLTEGQMAAHLAAALGLGTVIGRHRLVDALGRPGYRLRSIRSQDGPAPGRVTVSALLTAGGEAGRALEEAVSNLSLDPSVSAVSWSVVAGRGGPEE